jgi:hypothetical protein
MLAFDLRMPQEATLRRLPYSAIVRLACFLAIGALCPTASALANTYYISYSMGSNSNPGTQATPWKTHPYMPSGSECTETGSAPTFTHTAGDRFIFRGGDVWPNACLPLAPPSGGISSSYDYYGVDTTWFSTSSGSNAVACASGIVNTSGTSVTWASGSYFDRDSYGTWIGKTITINGMNYVISQVPSPSRLTLTSSAGTQTGVPYSGNLFCKPIIDSQSTLVRTNNIEFDMAKSVGPSYITVDNFEFRNHYWSGEFSYQKNVTIMCPGTGALVENNYIHGWSHAPYNSGATTDSYTAIFCNGQSDTTITYNTVQNADGAGDSGTAITDAYTISYNLIHDVSNGILSITVNV